MKIHDVRQGSPEWLKLRLGIPTASEFDALISPEWKIRTGQGPTTYLYRKLCERVMGFATDQGGSWEMGQGSILEHEALPWFEFTHETTVRRVGFCTTDDGRIGCSPDGLLEQIGGIEIKCPQPEAHLRYLMEKVLPKEHAAQVHGSMFVTGEPYWYFLSYSRQFPQFLIRVERDEKIQEAIREAMEGFLIRFDAKFTEITAMKAAENALQAAAHEAR